MKKEKLNIPTLSPILFRRDHIRNHTDELLNDDKITEFFIHSFKEDNVNLNLPLPPHKKTVNDFVFISNGWMIKNLGIESYSLQKNDFLFTPKNHITTTEFVSNDLEGYYCHFSDEFIGANPFLATLHIQASNQNYWRISENEAVNLHILLKRILELYKTQKDKPNNYRLLSFYLATFIAELFLICKTQADIPLQNNSLLANFKSIVYIHYKKNLNVKEYASLLNITPNHLNKQVKKEIGKTASEIIKEITILEAKVLLLQTKMSIKEISMELGFLDASYFSRLFKNETDYTPSDYKKMIALS